MGTTNATERMQRELDRAMNALRDDLDRVELLTAALSAFSRPIPEYEPSFRHVRRMKLASHELGEPAQD
ncbi:MAG: hypothetical protein ACTHLO_21385 [Pseudolabrys sp.]